MAWSTMIKYINPDTPPLSPKTTPLLSRYPNNYPSPSGHPRRRRRLRHDNRPPPPDHHLPAHHLPAHHLHHPPLVGNLPILLRHAHRPLPTNLPLPAFLPRPRAGHHRRRLGGHRHANRDRHNLPRIVRAEVLPRLHGEHHAPRIHGGGERLLHAARADHEAVLVVFGHGGLDGDRRSAKLWLRAHHGRPAGEVAVSVSACRCDHGALRGVLFRPAQLAGHGVVVRWAGEDCRHRAAPDGPAGRAVPEAQGESDA